jgi:hypothetical protein
MFDSSRVNLNKVGLEMSEKKRDLDLINFLQKSSE